MAAFNGFSFNTDAFFSTYPVYGGVVMPVYSGASFPALRVRTSGFYCQATSSASVNPSIVFGESLFIPAVSGAYFSPIRARTVSFLSSAQSAGFASGGTLLAAYISMDAISSSQMRPTRITFGDLGTVACYSDMTANGRYLWEREDVSPQAWSEIATSAQSWVNQTASSQDWVLTSTND
jgi:hypothetical protein